MQACNYLGIINVQMQTYLICRKLNFSLARAPRVPQERFGLSSLTFTQSLCRLPLHPRFPRSVPRHGDNFSGIWGAEGVCAPHRGRPSLPPTAPGCSGRAPAAQRGPSPAAPEPRAGPRAGERRGRIADRGGNMAAFLPNYETGCGHGITGESRPGGTPGRGAARGWE